MATDSWYWIGPSGPYPYEAGVTKCNDVNDRSGVAVGGQIDLLSLTTTGQLSVQTAPTAGSHVLREDDIGGIVGDVVGPASSTDNAAARFDLATGKLLQNSAFIIDNTGHVSSFGGQIKFPAAQVASADANTLDDYEEGSWTPVGALVVPGTISSGTQVGRYSKIGNRVFFTGYLSIIKGTGTGNFTITGLPFTSENVASGYTGVYMFGYGFGRAGHIPSATIAPNSTVITINMQPQSTGVSVAAQDTDMAATIYPNVFGSYVT
jgi:hypothetical protein